MQRRPTIKDVAALAEVAPSTVSRALSQPGRVNAYTAQAIFRAAEELGYHQVPRTDTGRRKRTHAISLVVSDVTNPFYSRIIHGAHEAALKAGYSLVLTHGSEQGEVEQVVLERALDLVEGVVLASSRMPAGAIRKIARQRPVILLNRRMPETPCVLIDDARGIELAATHLASLGHRDVTYLAGPHASFADGARWQELKRIAPELGMHVRRTSAHDSPTMETGFSAARVIADQRATAVIAYNDALGVGLIKGLGALGFSVPEAVSVVGFDNVRLSDVVSPGLTTIAAPLQAQGETGVRNLLALINGARLSNEPLVLPVTLRERESTAPPRTTIR
ncbi:LacI family DNA-binding transcriptional regulator [Demequina sp. NBRC 110051]|uniref:LacI family DNA-binding transcriptional regulator n=1 Tax=Demequina sp. NBRC 110051 TaxID=1570340 RepID=UPI00190EA1C7|nr:LacI family DNA-binding transcriptional regulator [Demequina sp. NBRC 110051]